MAAKRRKGANPNRILVSVPLAPLAAHCFVAALVGDSTVTGQITRRRLLSTAVQKYGDVCPLPCGRGSDSSRAPDPSRARQQAVRCCSRYVTVIRMAVLMRESFRALDEFRRARSRRPARAGCDPGHIDLPVMDLAVAAAMCSAFHGAERAPVALPALNWYGSQA